GEDTATVWGGDKDCEHEWISEERWLHRGSTKSEKIGAVQNAQITNLQLQDNFCSKCGAWRGQLGLEPTSELYIEHLRMVFAEVKRVQGNWNGHREPLSSYQGMDIKKMCDSAGKNPGDCWTINTQPFPDAHFAVFPEKLCEKPILAGCPAEVCKYCGMARVRITKTKLIKTQNIHRHQKYGDSGQFGHQAANRYRDGHIPGYNETETIGWTSCSCQQKDKYEPGIILDPFAGSGTVGVVAEKLNRSSILIDIKADYCEMAYNRIEELAAQTTLSGKRSIVMREGF
ncbi:unnamed protein product, partial [marine sediment metagenome]